MRIKFTENKRDRERDAINVRRLGRCIMLHQVCFCMKLFVDRVIEK